MSHKLIEHKPLTMKNPVWPNTEITSITISPKSGCRGSVPHPPLWNMPAKRDDG